jgi:hypothetical protein
MNSRKRITVALVGLIVLVLIGWLVRECAGSQQPQHHSLAVPVVGSVL